MEQYRLSERTFSLCWKTGEARTQQAARLGLKSHRADWRSENAINALGVIGEYVALRALSDGTLDDIRVGTPDGGRDIQLPCGCWMEIKTTTKMGYNFVFSGTVPPKPKEDFVSDFGVLVWSMDVERTYGVVGWCDRNQFQRECEWGHWLKHPSWWLSWRYFQPLDALRRHVNQHNQQQLTSRINS
jgi:hypothetical protein